MTRQQIHAMITARVYCAQLQAGLNRRFYDHNGVEMDLAKCSAQLATEILEASEAEYK